MDQFPSQDMLALIRSPAGQQLLALFQKQNPQTLAKAKQMAQSGDYGALQETLATLLRDPNTQRLLKQLGGGSSE